MNARDPKVKKPLKDRDLRTTTYHIRVAGLTIPFLLLLGIYTGYVHRGLPGAISGAVLAIVAGAVISAALVVMLDVLSGAASGLLTGRREAVWTSRELVQGPLSQARFNRENGDFKTAFSFVNQVLEKDPDYAEALFLKAQILWDGFGRSDTALLFLEKTLGLENDNAMVRNQALLLQQNLSALEMPPDARPVPQGIDIGLRPRKKPLRQKLNGLSLQALQHLVTETPVAAWAGYATVGVGLFLACLLTSTTRQIHRLDHVSAVVNRSTEGTRAATRAHAATIQKVQQSLQTLANELARVERKLKSK